LTQDLSTWQEVALVAGPIAAAIAALASWASVLQVRRLARESNAPHLQIQKVVDSPSGTIGVIVTNAGGGAARGAGIFLTHPPFFIRGAIGHGFLYPGETRQVLTRIPATEAETDALVFCRDKDSLPHYWNANEEHRVFTTWRGRPKYRRDIPAAFREFHPVVDPDEMTQVEMQVTAVPSS
jgi:hypothetical protein